MKTVKLLGTLLAAPISMLALETAAFASAPSWVKFRSVDYNGRGCPLGTVSETISQDRQAFTLAFSEYVAEVGSDLPRSESYKNCVVTVDLEFPAGWQFALTKYDYRGYAQLDRGVEATQNTNYWFMGETGGKASTKLKGPYDQDFHFTDYVPTEIYSRCGTVRPLVINSSIRLNNRRNKNGTGFMTLDSLDGSVAWQFGIRWRKCRR